MPACRPTYLFYGLTGSPLFVALADVSSSWVRSWVNRSIILSSQISGRQRARRFSRKNQEIFDITRHRKCILFFQMNATFVNRTKLFQMESDVNMTDSFPELWVTKAGLQFEVNTFQVRQLRILCIADLFQMFSTRTEVVLTEEKPRLASILYTSRDSASCEYLFVLISFLRSVMGEFCIIG